MIPHPNTPVTRLLSKLILCRPERHPWSLRRHLARGGALTAILLSINTKPGKCSQRLLQWSFKQHLVHLGE